MIWKEPFGTAEKYTLSNGKLTVSLLTFGATVQRIVFDEKDMVLGYDDLAGYQEQEGYLGAAIGRYGNRIAHGKFALDGEEISLSCNENGITCLHGGNVGFSHRLWHANSADGAEPTVTFSRLSQNGEEGFPGNLAVSVTYTVTADNALKIEYTAHTDAPTVVNLTNHSYFSLGGTNVGNIILQIDADSINAVDSTLIPTGNWIDVGGTPFDFREPKPIGRDIDTPDNVQLQYGGGYDHNYLLNGEGYRKVMEALSMESGIRMTCFTDQPAGQLYTANVLNNPVGRGGRPLTRRTALCFETQHCPDSPNHPAFPSTRLDPGETYRTVTAYRFEKPDDLT